MWLSHFQFGEIHELGQGRSSDSLFPAPALNQSVSQRREEFLKLGMSPGHRVVLFHHNSAAFFVDLLAVWHTGACAIPLEGKVCAELKQLWQAQLRAHWAVDTPGAARALEDRATALWPENIVLALLTSGSTAQPKVTLHTAEALTLKMAALAKAIPLAETEVTLCALPTYFGHGLVCNALFPWLHGAKLVLAEAFSPRLIAELDQVVADHEVRFLSSTPATWSLMAELGRPSQKASLQRVHCASAALSEVNKTTLQTWAGPERAFNVYGLTEFLGWVSGAPLEGGGLGAGWGTEMQTGTDGEIQLRAPFRMHASVLMDDVLQLVYEDLTSWHGTRDLGRLSGGQLEWLGRMDSTINKGGLKIQPEEVEMAYAGHPALRDCVAGAVNDPLWGQRLVLILSLRPGQKVSLTELKTWAAGRLAPYKIPDEFCVTHESLRNERGKLERRRFGELWRLSESEKI